MRSANLAGLGARADHDSLVFAVLRVAVDVRRAVAVANVYVAIGQKCHVGRAEAARIFVNACLYRIALRPLHDAVEVGFHHKPPPGVAVVEKLMSVLLTKIEAMRPSRK